MAKWCVEIERLRGALRGLHKLGLGEGIALFVAERVGLVEGIKEPARVLLVVWHVGRASLNFASAVLA